MHTGGLWSGSVRKLMQPPCCQPVFLHDWPAGRLPGFFFLLTLSLLSRPSLHAQPLLASASLAPLAAPLHFNPPHLSPYLRLPSAEGRRVFFLFFFLAAVKRCQGYQGWQRDWRWKSSLFDSLAGTHAEEPSAGGRERTDPHLCFLMRESCITVPPRCFFSGIFIELNARCHVSWSRVRSGANNPTNCWDEMQSRDLLISPRRGGPASNAVCFSLSRLRDEAASCFHCNLVHSSRSQKV